MLVNIREPHFVQLRGQVDRGQQAQVRGPTAKPQLRGDRQVHLPPGILALEPRPMLNVGSPTFNNVCLRVYIHSGEVLPETSRAFFYDSDGRKLKDEDCFP
jgi:hypothetical protein